jgi:hypothetical protein
MKMTLMSWQTKKLERVISGLCFVVAFTLSLSAVADPAAIKVPEELRGDRRVKAMISEYNKIAASSEVCNDKRFFGLRVVKVDGQPRVRYYVDGKGIGCVPSRLQPNEPWRITRQDWVAQDDQNFAAFLRSRGTAVAEGKCATVDSCLISSANIVKTPSDEQAFHYADCADFPFYLRAYYSFRAGLPFSYATNMRARALTTDDQKRNLKIDSEIQALLQRAQMGGQLSAAEQGKLKQLQKAQTLRSDPRYTPNGNYVANRGWITEDGQINFYSWVASFRNSISTATLRVWRNQGENRYDRNGNVITELEPDFYSPRLDPSGIKPGTVVYKVDGHTAIVYKVDYQTGLIYYIDAHPDNSLSHGVIDDAWTNEFTTRANFGGGFKNFRPTVYERAWFFGAPKARLKTDQELGEAFSSEQYDRFTSPSSTVEMKVGNVKAQVGYADFLRLRLSGGKYRIDPIVQMRADADALCRNIQVRKEDVAIATEKDIHLLPHPEALPNNIFGADGDWEKYSSPGRDVTFKARVLNFAGNLKKYREMINAKHFLMKPGLTVALMKDQARAVWNEVSNSCKVSYINSVGQEVAFNLAEAVKRAPLMAFDPYLCPEHRFGATDARELSTCTDTAEKNDWYLYQQFLRNRTVKTNLEPMGWKLDELRAMGNAATLDQSLVEKLDILKQIDSL